MDLDLDILINCYEFPQRLSESATRKQGGHATRLWVNGSTNRQRHHHCFALFFFSIIDLLIECHWKVIDIYKINDQWSFTRGSLRQIVKRSQSGSLRTILYMAVTVYQRF